MTRENGFPLLKDAVALAEAEAKLIPFLRAFRRAHGPGVDLGVEFPVIVVHALRDTYFAPPPLARALLRSLCQRGLVEATVEDRYRLRIDSDPLPDDRKDMP